MKPTIPKYSLSVPLTGCDAELHFLKAKPSREDFDGILEFLDLAKKQFLKREKPSLKIKVEDSYQI